MKFALIAALAVMLPLPATAQSLSDTHELVWHPAGKTPGVTFRLRDKPACSERNQQHQAGKNALPAPAKCAVASARTKNPSAELAAN